MAGKNGHLFIKNQKTFVMAFFQNPEVEKKYQNTNGDKDPIVTVAIQYRGKLSGVPLNIADKLHADGAHIKIKTKQEPQETTPKKK